MLRKYVKGEHMNIFSSNKYTQELINVINLFPDSPYTTNNELLIKLLNVFDDFCKIADDNPHECLYQNLFEYLENQKNSAKIVLQFELLWHICEPSYTLRFIDFCLNNPELSFENKYYMYGQLSANIFVTPGASDDKVTYSMRNYYRTLYNDFSNYVNVSVDYYKTEERNSDLVFVMTNQFLSLNHGPTKTALDRCYELIINQHKQVILINTAEQNSTTGFISLLYFRHNNYINDYSSLKYFPYKGIYIPFIQCNYNTPDYDSTIDILNVVDQYKPYCIFHIGGSSLITDMCSRIVPTISIATVPSGLCTSEGTFQVIGHSLSEFEKKYLTEFGFNESHVIQSLFTSNFKEQTTTLSRDDLSLPNDRFIMIVVGARLTDEVTNEFLETILPLLEQGAHIAFAGTFDTYDSLCELFPTLSDNSTYLGFQNDMLAVVECCDLYVNPKRIGGGTSVAEAMYKGLPAVTLKHGDVALGAGDEFCVDNYTEMQSIILKYMTDSNFYSEMSKHALQRVQLLMDTHSSFQNIMNEFKNRITILEEEMQ